MRARDIEALISLGRPTLAPDGSFAVVASSRPDVTANRNVGQLWRVDLDGAGARRLTRGVADRAPQLAPDGESVAFLRADANDRAQVFVLPMEGGEAVQATDAADGVSAFAWHPDGTMLAYTSRVSEPGRYGSVPGLDAAHEAPRRITGVRWHANGLGYIADRPSQLFVIEVPDLTGEPRYPVAPAVPPAGAPAAEDHPITARARRLTDDEASYSSIAFSRDGASVVAVRDVIEHDGRDLRTPVVAIPVAGGPAHNLLGAHAGLAVSDVLPLEGGRMAVLAADMGEHGRDFVAPGVALMLVERDGSVRVLTDPETVDLGEVGSHVSAFDDGFVVQRRTRGRVHLLHVDLAGRATALLDGDVEVGGHAVAAGRVVASAATPTSLGELFVVGVGAVTAFGASLDEDDVRLPAEHVIEGRDGTPVHGWTVVPEGDGPFPVILQIHGGPYAAYGIHLFDEMQVLAAAGYAVVYANPRGSAGYGRAHGRSIRGAMGTVDLHDVLDFLDGTIASDPRLDGSRVGIMGGSYGGYLTAWTIAHDQRFAGAIVERGFLDPHTFQGTSDIGSFFGDEYVGVDPAAIDAQSPFAVVDRVRTPTLVVHSELDYRCPLEQSTRYYTALRRQGTPAELLIFPGEDHELSRSGQPRHRVERFDAVLEWWARHLPVG